MVFGYLVAYSGGYELPFIPMLVLLCVGILLWLRVDPTERVIAEDPPHVLGVELAAERGAIQLRSAAKSP